MLHLFAKRLSSKFQIFRFKIFILSFVCHFILLVFCLFVHDKSNLNVCIKNRISHSAVPIILVPLAKNISGALQNIKKSNNQSVGAMSINAVQKNDLAKQQKITVHSQNSKSVTSLKIEISKKIVIEKDIAKNKLKNENKLETQKKQNVLKMNIDQNKKKVSAQKGSKPNVETAKQKIVKEVEQIKATNVSPVVGDANIANSNIEIQNSNDAVYVGRNDLELNEIEDMINTTIRKNWNPPPGLSKKLKTVLSCYINYSGKVENIQIKERSKSIAFDLSAKKSLENAKFSKQMWGRQITPQFGPED